MTRTAVATDEEPNSPGWSQEFTVGGYHSFRLTVVERQGQIHSLHITCLRDHGSSRGDYMAEQMLEWYLRQQVQRLKSGEPMAGIVQEHLGVDFYPSGMTDDDDVWMAGSVIDYIFRRIGLRYLTDEQKQQLGLLRPRPFGRQGPRPDSADAPMCYRCGVQMQRAGSLYACPGCGTTSDRG